jgi:hypothetical protein
VQNILAEPIDNSHIKPRRKLMFRKTIAPLFAGMVVTGLSSTVYAQPITPAPTDNSFNTRSGESLRGLQNRSISKDSSTFSETSPLSGISPMSIRNSSTRRSPSVRLSDGIKSYSGKHIHFYRLFRVFGSQRSSKS